MFREGKTVTLQSKAGKPLAQLKQVRGNLAQWLLSF